jgi:sulfoxide reductase catalytic subunit YedY
MPNQKALSLPYSEVTPKRDYLSRRALLSAAGFSLGALRAAAAAKLSGYKKSPFSTSEKQTPYSAITSYNNYYEFGLDKDMPARNARNFKTSPWTIRIGGEVAKEKSIDFDALMKLAPLEERVYRLRCVEGWSMVVPWIGFPLSALIKASEPTTKANFVQFETYFNASQMPEAQYAGLLFPYIEALRIDEAFHPLTILSVGLYGETLPNQNGAPVRLVVPWKYGFKSVKSIARIKFTEKRPATTWTIANPREYGFYANVNPEVDHPRWSQARERRIGEFGKRDTLKFNGYADQVASLYSGLDLRKNY